MEIKFSTNNAAFEYDGGIHEIGRILTAISDAVESGKKSGPVMDINGNKIGRWSL